MRRLAGLWEWQISELQRALPNQRGALRVARYYDAGPFSRHVVYQVLDEHHRALPDGERPVWEIDASQPWTLSERPVGAIFDIR